MQPPPYTAPYPAPYPASYPAPCGPTMYTNEHWQPPPPLVVTTQPTTVPMSPPVYKDYLAWSIVNMLFCCLPLGIVALIFSMQTRDASHRYDSLAASNQSHLAFIWNMVLTGLGSCINIVWIAYITYYIVT